MKQNRTGIRSSGAFTLVEVIVGIAVFSIVMLGVFAIYSQSLDAFANLRDANRISQTMQYQIESLRGMQWVDFVEEKGKKTIKVDKWGMPTTGSSKTPYDWQSFKLEQDISLVKTDHYEVELTAQWTDADGDKRERVMKTWMTNDGLNLYYTRSSN